MFKRLILVPAVIGLGVALFFTLTGARFDVLSYVVASVAMFVQITILDLMKEK